MRCSLSTQRFADIPHSSASYAPNARDNALLGRLSHIQQSAGMWRRTAQLLPPLCRSLGGGTTPGRLLPLHRRFSAALPEAVSSANGASSNGTATRKAAEPKPKVNEAHSAYLRGLMKNQQMEQLLIDSDFHRKQLGLPKAKLEQLKADGALGMSQVRKLLYTSEEYDSTLPSSQGSTPVGSAHNAVAAGAAAAAVRRPAAGTTAATPASTTSSSSGGVGSEKAAAATPGPAATATATATATASIRDVLNQQRILLNRYSPGTYRIKCPKCKGGSKGELSFGVTIDEDSKSAVWNCFRAKCGYSGQSHVDKPSLINKSGFFVSPTARKRKEEPPVRPQPALEALSEEMVEFFAARRITASTLARNGVSSEVVYDPGLKQSSRVIAFPYLRDSGVVNVKYRTLDKRFWQVRGAEKVLYGLDDVEGAAEVVIVEGEMDKLALEEAGMQNVVSVPDGAPARVKEGDLPPASEDTKYSYLWNCRAWLDQAVRIVIATDNDAPGDALAEELARRLGRERCWRVRWPLTRTDHEYASSFASLEFPSETEEKAAATVAAAAAAAGGEGSSAAASAAANGLAAQAGAFIADPGSPPTVDERWYRKDANEVLIRDGPELLKAFVEAAEPLPIRGLLRFHEYYDDIIKHYYLQLRDGQGVSTGWPVLDRCYKVVPGELTIVTGVPNSGKSEWIDALLCNLSEMHGWTFALCSMEKRATDHARQLAEKYVGKPFFDLPYGRGMRRMSQEELERALDWVDDRFHLIRYEDDQLPSVDWVLEIAKAAVYRYGIRGLVIDPYNELDHQRPAAMSETEYVSQMLTKVKRFAQTAGVHVWFVAHPRQLREWRGEAPNLYDISGSAHFINKTDNGIVVHRNRDPNDPNTRQVQVMVRKVRNKAAGTIGECILEYERINGRYLDMEDEGAPRTAQKIDMKKQQQWEQQQMQVQQMSEELAAAAAPAQQTFVWSDGSVNNEPEPRD